ncbi:MAG: acyltransferase, partial [SAR86 cluster bacterium]|nr:acyltransferase [SAR86 cluster bacterium]
MDEVRRFFVGILTFFAILIILSFWLIPLSIANTPRIIPNQNLKIYLGSVSNKMGNA